MKTPEIPDFPRIKMSNYVAKLPGNISIIPNNNWISFFLTEEIVNDTAIKLNIPEKTIKRYISNGRYPLRFIRQLDDLRNMNITKTIEDRGGIFFSKWKRVLLPRCLTPKLAYFLGYLQGDGSIESNGKRINFTDDSKEQLKNINNICLNTFGIKGNIQEVKSKISKKAAYRLEIGSFVLNSYLNKIFDINKGIKRNLKIPKIFWDNKEILRWYLVGLFDADGTLPKNPELAKHIFIDITMKDEAFIKSIRMSLRYFGIETLRPYCRIAKSPGSDKISKTWELRIRKKKDIIRFLKAVSFIHPDKVRRVEKLIKFMHL